MNATRGVAGTALTHYCTPDACAYFLDFDGTLVEIADRPDAVAADPLLRDLLQTLAAAASGALAIISGRPITDIDRWFHPLKLPVAGQHGVERRDASGSLHRHPLEDTALNELRAAATEWQRQFHGLLIEDKGLSIAFHFRKNPVVASPLEALLRAQLHRMQRPFHLQTGKMVLEVKPDGLDKGRAIRAFLTEAPFLGRTPVFIGDYDTDEYGFAEVNQLGGLSFKVGAGPTLALQRFDDVAAVRTWLRSVLTSVDVEGCHA